MFERSLSSAGKQLGVVNDPSYQMLMLADVTSPTPAAGVRLWGPAGSMETSHFIYMRKCEQLIGFCGTWNSEMAFCGGGQKEGLMGGEEMHDFPRACSVFFFTVCVTSCLGRRPKKEGGEIL